MAKLIPTPGPKQISEKHKSERPAFLNMSGFVVVEVVQGAALECRVENLAKLLSVRKSETVNWSERSLCVALRRAQAERSGHS